MARTRKASALSDSQILVENPRKRAKLDDESQAGRTGSIPLRYLLKLLI